MGTTAAMVVGIALLAIIGSTVWRLGSSRRSLPCPACLAWMVEMDNPFTRANRAAVIIEHLRVEPGMAVLDAGCGPGRLTLPLAKAVGPAGHVLAIDLQQGMLHRVHAKLRDASVTHVDLLQAGLGENQLPDARFDRAVLVTVLGEIPHQAAAMAELHRTMKPGGLLAVTEVIFDPHFQSQSHTRSLAAAAGFTHEVTHGWRLAYTTLLRKPTDGAPTAGGC